MTPIGLHLFFVHVWENYGAPYIWRGKGSMLWTPRGLVPHDFGMPVFDCSGLVTHALWQAGGPDLRGTFNAQRMWNEWEPGTNSKGCVALFGRSDTDIDHVAVCLGEGQGLEACGGDGTTVDLLESARRGARVRGGYFRRADIRGYRQLPSLTS